MQWAQFAALAGVIVDHVENHLDAGPVEFADQGLELGDLATRRAPAAIGGLGREEADRVIAPIVGEAAPGQKVIDIVFVNRQQLDGVQPEDAGTGSSLQSRDKSRGSGRPKKRGQ